MLLHERRRKTSQKALTRRLFLTFSELQHHEDGVGATSRHRDARDVSLRVSRCHAQDRLQVEVVKLNDELAEILNEADYMKEKEVRFHRKAERINVAAVWWPVLQIGILVLTAVLQVQSLKNYFQAKNLY